MKKFIYQLAIFAEILGTVGFMLKNELTTTEKFFILSLAINATMYFSLLIDKLEESKSE